MKFKGKIITLLATSLFIVACNNGGPNYGKKLSDEETIKYVEEHYSDEYRSVIRTCAVWDFSATTGEEEKKIALELINSFDEMRETKLLKGEQERTYEHPYISDDPLNKDKLEGFYSEKNISKHANFINNKNQLTLVGYNGYDSERHPHLFASFVRLTHNDKGYDIEDEFNYVRNNKYNCKVIGNIKITYTFED